MYLINRPLVLDLTIWKPLKRPGFFGSRRAQIEAILNRNCGPDGWTLGWKVGDFFLSYVAFVGSKLRLLDFVCQHSDVYDNSVTNVECGLDYIHEETRRTRSNHIQDIAIRWAVLRLGRSFDQNGDLLEVRGYKSKGHALSPGVVPFHRPDLIPRPELRPMWAREGSVEAFWQSSKHLMVRTELLK